MDPSGLLLFEGTIIDPKCASRCSQVRLPSPRIKSGMTKVIGISDQLSR